MSKTYKIKIVGCDDSTIFNMELTESEFELLKRVEEKANETSTYGCMPKFYINELKPEWIEVTTDGRFWECNVCEGIVPMELTKYSFCPNCGAKLKGKNNELEIIKQEIEMIKTNNGERKETE